MSSFVLVHGAWYGGWCWTRVAQRLRDTGHDVFTPTLSGLGEQPEPGAEAIDLRTHAEDVLKVLVEYDLEDVVLVGHSYGGLVVREAADSLPDYVQELVLIDAWAGIDGQSLDSLAPAFFKAWIDSATSGGLIAVPPASSVGVVDPQQAAWLEDRLRPQPRLTFSQRTSLSGAVEDIPCRAILCTPHGPMPFAEFAQAFGWPTTEIASGHDVMTLAPDQLAELLLNP
ncbi:alpha/beta hydrolase family protein [Kribbella sp. NPDC051137]|uniref:alpha/beta fold hydrolase n=1 Tax=Kribbella sp. NPDC051137 TaxID=3155045 RepID=UPI00342E3FAF